MVAPAAQPWSRPGWWAARSVVWARWLVLAAWLLVAVAAVLRLPVPVNGAAGLGDLTSADNPALLAEQQSAKDFGFPLLSRTALVQSDPSGLPDSAVQHAVDHARRVSADPGTSGLVAALPVPGDARIPGVRQPGTTVITYLYPQPGRSLAQSVHDAHAYAGQFEAADRVLGVTGTGPARAEQERLVAGALPTLEFASLAAVLLIVGLAFRSLVAPVLTLAVAGLAFELVTRLSGVLATQLGVRIPADLEPLMVALILGVCTDYVVYFLSGMRGELRTGHGRLDAARRAGATFGPIVVVAGVTITAGVSTLALARTPAIRIFGPAMALSVLVSMVVAVTVLPAAMAILGRLAFWPRRLTVNHAAAAGGPVRRASVRLLRNRFGALLVICAGVAGLVVVALPVQQLRGGLPFVAALPAASEPARGAAAAGAGFAPGILSPTLVDVRPAGAGTSVEALARLEDLVRQEPHVAGVLGPREDAAVSATAGREVGAFVRQSPLAGRYLVVLDVDPLDATAVAAVGALHDRLPGLITRAGMDPATGYDLGGDTAAVAAVIDQTDRDLRVVLLAALLVNLVILIGYLRALVAPILLLGCTALSAAATLGLTVTVFQHRLDHPGVTFFVPLATGVLLLALGSDYNLFAIGHVWEEARRRPLREAMLTALPRSSGAITIAGIALAASLGSLALVPLRQFRELAFALVVGILIDALVVRTLLAPAMVALFGRFSGWPGHRLDPEPPVRPAPLAEPSRDALISPKKGVS